MERGWEEAGGEHLARGVARRRLPRWDATAGLVHGPDAVLVVDAGASLAEGADIRRWARRLAGRDVTHLAFTHGHFDHVLGAAAFAGAETYAAVGLDRLLAGGRETVAADAVRHGLDAGDAAEAADLLVRPRHLVSGEMAVALGGGREAVLVNIGPGHTPHDLVVLVPGDPCVVFCGDLVEQSGEPQAGPDAVPGRWPAALDRLVELGGANALYVPGHGAVVDARFVRAQREALAARFGVS
ncbi:MBL fold metallo-hydrolase [Streptomyces sp. F63]|uniref:MBL fold metallo-hydrolase n=1 Tax=Streptomyces sp. F63 TaxID=2824887 RepID=UPI001B38AE9D|nr:MBL fold metallo-hydrolase [Streptomyces sp. F63]MBQ0987707.1 MBL fold metallo-hydrolase [Streptomyces sp. F63]